MDGKLMAVPHTEFKSKFSPGDEVYCIITEDYKLVNDDFNALLSDSAGAFDVLCRGTVAGELCAQPP